jgi:type IV pilus assembly protein PilE
VQLISNDKQPTKPLAAPAGFTLIELMIVVTVVSLLALIGYPMFVDQVQKSRRAEAIAALNRIAQAQERWRANNPTYSNSLAVGALNVPNPGSGYYTLSVATDVATAGKRYVATATAAGAQAADSRCTSLVMTMDAGNFSYTSTGSAPAAKCWNR